MNRIVIITGASSGIGLCTKQLFLDNGDIVYNISKSCEQDEFNFCCDVSDSENIKQIIEQIGNKHGRIDILINNAGYGISGAMELTSVEAMENIFNTNTKGVFLTCKYAIPFMPKNSHIINISSTCALFPVPFRGLYCASKSAVQMMSYAYAMELKKSKIAVCAICPGEVKTNFTKNRIKNFDTNSRYENRIANAAYAIDKNDSKRMPPIKVSKTIFKTCNKKTCKPFVIVGGKMKFLNFVTKFIPTSLWIKITEKFMGGNKEQKNNPYLSEK